jgi:hypothetical protein
MVEVLEAEQAAGMEVIGVSAIGAWVVMGQVAMGLAALLEVVEEELELRSGC